MLTEAGHSSESAASEYTTNSLPADENTPLVREDNSRSRQVRCCEHFNCRHFLLIGLSLLSFAEVVLLMTNGIANSRTVSLKVVEIGNCFFFLGIIVKSPSFAGFSTVLRDLCFLPNFWTLLLFFLLYLIGGSINIDSYHKLYMECIQYRILHKYEKCYGFQLAVVKSILEILDFFTMMILVVFLNHTNLRYTISGRVWVYRMLKGTLVMFCFRVFVPVVVNITNTSITLIDVPDKDADTIKAQIINEILLLPFCKKIIELLWQKIFFDEKCIIGKIRRNRGTRQITFVV